MTSILYNNFVRGKLDKDLSGRFDLPVFTNGFPKIENFISNYKGILKYRTGFEYVSETKKENNKTIPARLIEFKFNTEQSYLLEITYNEMRFYTYDKDGNFGYVVDDNGNIVKLDLNGFINVFKMQHTQNADVMIFAEQGMKPKELNRLGASMFTIEDASISGISSEDFGNPRAVSYHKGRLWYGGFVKKPTTVIGSEFAGYDNFVLKTSDIKETDPVQFTLTDISDPILWIFGGKKNLIIGNSEGISTINGGNSDLQVTATKVNADLCNKDACSSAYPTEKDGEVIYVGLDKERAYSFNYDMYSESFVSSNLNLLTDINNKIEELHYKRDRNNLIYGRTSDGQLIALLYNKAENIVGWFPIKTEGRVVSMTTVARPDGKDDLFICVERGMKYDENGKKIIDGVYYIERLSDEPEFSEFDETIETKKEFHKRQLEELSKVNFLDCSVTLKGEKLSVNAIVHKDNFMIIKTGYPDVVEKLKEGMTVKLVQRFYQNNILKQHEQTVLIKRIEEDDADRVYYYIDGEFEHRVNATQIYLPINAVGDLDDCEGQYQSIFADGGYVGTYLVENGQIILDRPFTTITIGYPYTGIAKTFNIGSWYDGFNSQTAKKRVVSMIVRFLNSASFKIGTALSNLQPMQEFKPDGFYDSAPVLMDGDVTLNGYNDTHDKEKCLYFVQDEPTPCNITMVDCNVSFSKMG
jgi:hypothetical protein